MPYKKYQGPPIVVRFANVKIVSDFIWICFFTFELSLAMFTSHFLRNKHCQMIHDTHVEKSIPHKTGKKFTFAKYIYLFQF